MATALPRIETSFTLEDIARSTGGALHGDASLRLAGLSTDTRALQPGALFIALRGERFDGHDHLDAALRAGARALLVRDGAAVPEGVVMNVSALGRPGVRATVAVVAGVRPAELAVRV